MQQLGFHRYLLEAFAFSTKGLADPSSFSHTGLDESTPPHFTQYSVTCAFSGGMKTSPWRKH